MDGPSGLWRLYEILDLDVFAGGNGESLRMNGSAVLSLDLNFALSGLDRDHAWQAASRLAIDEELGRCQQAIIPADQGALSL